MGEKEKIFKTIILFLFLLFGCSQKYADVEVKSFGGKATGSSKQLCCTVVEQDEEAFSLNCKIEYSVIVKDSVKTKEFGRREELKKADILIALGMASIYSGCLGGFYYVKSQDYPTDEVFETGCFISSVSCLTGLAMIVGGGKRRLTVVESGYDLIKRDTACVDSILLIGQKIKVELEESNFEKIFWTDENGNIELRFEEIIPEPTEADSTLNLIVKYEEMVDTVDVGIGL